MRGPPRRAREPAADLGSRRGHGPEHPRASRAATTPASTSVRWRTGRQHVHAIAAASASFVGCGAIVGFDRGPIAGAIAAALGGLLGGAAGMLHDRSEARAEGAHLRANRIAALERGLALKGEMGATPVDLVGAVLGGKFRIGQKIGSGGIGVVYAAEHVALGHEVAIKVLRGAAARDGGEIAASAARRTSRSTSTIRTWRACSTSTRCPTARSTS